MKLGELLILHGFISEEQLRQALEAQKAQPHKKLGEVLVEMGYISVAVLAEILTKQ